MPQQNLEDFRRAFDAAVQNLSLEKGSSTFLLSRKQYDEIVQRITELNNSADEKKTSKDYRLLKRYEVFAINSDKKLRKNGTLNRYLCNDELFDAIHTAHLSTGHGARDIHPQQNKCFVRERD